MSGNCSIMEDLSESTFLKAALLINLTICTCAIPLLLWASWKFWTVKYTKLFHVNFKILVQVHLCGFLFHCTARVILHSIDLINYTSIDEPCDMIPNIYRCFILRLLYNTGFWLTNATAVSLVVERWLATKRSETYEKDSAVIGLLLAIMQVIIAAIPLGVIYSTFSFNRAMYYCMTAQASLPYTPQLSAFLGISFQVTARISFHFLYCQNELRIADVYGDENPPRSLRQLRNATFHSTLSNRYQLEQNISSITCLKTFTNLSSAYVIFQNACFVILMYYAQSLFSHHFFALVETACALPTYSIVSVIVMGRNVSSIRKRIENQLVGHLKTPNEHYIDNFKKQIA